MKPTLYGPHHRALQDRFDARRIADFIESHNIRRSFDEFDKAFIETRDMFWLASVDQAGQPTVSYKGGDPGFVRVLDENTLVFPSYDGNGMFLSMGNIASSRNVGLLFMDFDKPNRLRVQGTASFRMDDPLLECFPEAQLIVRVTPSQIFLNCNRYVHRYQKISASKYVPRVGVKTPLASWKRIDLIQDALPKTDEPLCQEDLITLEGWVDLIVQGDENT